MPISQAYSISASTVGATEYSIVTDSTTLANDTTDGVYQLEVDTSTMAKGDVYRIRIYEKAIAGAGKRLKVSGTIMGVQVENVTSPSLILMNGWDMTITKISGTDRAFSASIRQVA